MREHLKFKVKVHEKRVESPIVGLGDFLKNVDNQGIWTKIANIGSKVSETTSKFVVWRRAIDGIEGKFGSGVGSFFRFLRLLLALNLLSFVLR